jgi:hypothetical protein
MEYLKGELSMHKKQVSVQIGKGAKKQVAKSLKINEERQ